MDAARQYERDTGLPAYRKAGAFQGWPTPPNTPRGLSIAYECL